MLAEIFEVPDYLPSFIGCVDLLVVITSAYDRMSHTFYVSVYIPYVLCITLFIMLLHN